MASHKGPQQVAQTFRTRNTGSSDRRSSRGTEKDRFRSRPRSGTHSHRICSAGIEKKKGCVGKPLSQKGAETRGNKRANGQQCESRLLRTKGACAPPRLPCGTRNRVSQRLMARLGREKIGETRMRTDTMANHGEERDDVHLNCFRAVLLLHVFAGQLLQHGADARLQVLLVHVLHEAQHRLLRRRSHLAKGGANKTHMMCESTTKPLEIRSLWGAVPAMRLPIGLRCGARERNSKRTASPRAHESHKRATYTHTHLLRVVREQLQHERKQGIPQVLVPLFPSEKSSTVRYMRNHSSHINFHGSSAHICRSRAIT